MIGQAWSTSLNAGIIRFVGGPNDGQSGLFDFDRYNSIAFGDMKLKVTDEYQRIGDYLFGYKRSFRWSRFAGCPNAFAGIP